MTILSQAVRSPLFIFGAIITLFFGFGILSGLGIVRFDSNFFLLMLPIFSLWMAGAAIAGIPGILLFILLPFVFGIWCMKRALRRIREQNVTG